MLVGLCSCVNRGPVATITTETGIPMRVTEFTYKGHSYIWFSKSSGQSGMVLNHCFSITKRYISDGSG